MRKSNLISLLISGLIFAGFASPVKAGTVLSIQSLPSYINYRDFKLSCTSDSTSVTFSVSKHGGGAAAFATVNPASGCVAQVTSSQIPEETDYTFTVTDNDNLTLTASTSTIFDNSGPSSVSGYYKEDLNDGFKLHWTNPGEDDFSGVIIYRGDSAGFSADSSHQITVIYGGRASPMTYDDHFSKDPTKTYYYYIRAVDKAGNSSGLVGDSGTTTVATTPAPGMGSSRVVQLPKEAAKGSILGTEVTLTPAPSTSPAASVGSIITNPANLLRWIMTHKKISLLAALVLGQAIYFLFRKRKS